MVKAFAFLLAVLLPAVALVGAILLLVTLTPDREPLWAGLAGAAVSLLLYAGILLGSLCAFWDVDASEESRVIYRRWLIGTVLIEAAAAILLLWCTLVTGMPPWFPALCIGVCVALTVVAPRIGTALRRRDGRTGDSNSGGMDDTFRVRRTAAGIGITFVVTIVVATAGLLTLDTVLNGGLRDVGTMVILALGMALLAAALAGSIGSFSVNRRLRSIASHDLGRVRRFARAVLRGKAESFSEHEQAAALEYSRVAPLAIKLQGVSITLLYVGLALQQVAMITLRPEDALLPTIVLVALGAMYVGVIPFVVMQLRRARRYRALHGDARGASARP